MIILVIFAFIAGVVTILSPCILPVLPIVLSESTRTGKKRPLGVVTGFIASFTIFTLFLTWLVRTFNLPAESLRFLAATVILIFGLTYLFPKTQPLIKSLFSKLPKPKVIQREGYGGGILMGLAIGLVWTPCVGLILASVIALAVSGAVTFNAFVIMFFYALGTAIPMFLVIKSGQSLITKYPLLLKNLTKIQIAFGALMIVTSILIFTDFDRKFQIYILDKFPKWGQGLTSFEDNKSVKDSLDNLVGTESKSSLRDSGEAPEIIPGGEWFNSEPLQLSELRGKVVLIDFWTYTCINCIRTFPYLRNWYDSYKDKGLVIIGVHTPEFEFEKNPKNVAGAIKDFELTYPVVQDNDYSTWRAYKNRYWPAKYLIDASGRVRYTHFGEGKYDETERIIQELLEEAGKDVGSVNISNPNYQVNARTPEFYLGYSRIEYFASLENIGKDLDKAYTYPSLLPTNSFAFSGKWKSMEETSLAYEGSRMKVNFFAGKVFLVMRSDNTAKVRVYLDGDLIGKDESGKDVIGGVVTIDKDKLYELVELDSAGGHELEIEFVEGEVELYAFTFG